MQEIASTRVTRTLDDIAATADLWRSWGSHPNADIAAYLYTLAARPEVIAPYIITVLRGDIPEALLVARCEWLSVPIRVGYWKLFELKVRALTFIHGGFLGQQSLAASEAAMTQILTSLKTGEADVAFFSHLHADSHLHLCATAMPGFFVRDPFPTIQIHRAMTVPESAEAFRLRLSPKVRKNQRLQARKLESDHSGNAEVRCFRDVSELDVMFRDVEEIARKTYQRGLGVGFVDSTEMRGRLELNARQGWLRAFVLYIAGSPWAFWIGTSYGRTFHSDYMGYDPAHGSYSPGMYLAMKVIEQLCDHTGSEGITEIDFGLGDAQYKKILADREWRDASLYVFGWSLKGLATSLLRMPALLAERAARAGLERTGLVSRIKRLWRGSMSRRAQSDTMINSKDKRNRDE
jgi:hypothetical protein